MVREAARPGLFTAPDGMFHNDLGYECVSQTLARQIVAAIEARVAMAASK